MTAATDLAFPEIKINPKKFNTILPPWLSKGVLVSIKTKQKLFINKRKFPTLENREKFLIYNRILNTTKRKAKKLYFTEEFQGARKDLKRTWELINVVTGRSTKGQQILPNSFTEKDQIISDPKQISNKFNSFFTTIGQKLEQEISDIPNIDSQYDLNNQHMKYLTTPSVTEFSFFPVSETRLYKAVSSLKSKWSYGDSVISNNLLKRIYPIIAEPFRKLINLSLSTGFVPSQLTLAKIIPIHKGGDAKLYTNYRPIAMVSSLSKLLEKVVSTQLNDFLYATNALSPFQFGFREKHSVSHPLLLFSEFAHKALVKNEYTIAVFVDVKKAFDTVNYKVLCDKLFYYGIRNKELLWFVNYLKRSQYVLANSTISEIMKLFMGIPQGTLLSSVLFSIFINDLPLATRLLTLLFADDCTYQSSGPDLFKLIEYLNTELAKAQNWFAANRLTLNLEKTKFLITSEKTLPNILPPIMIGDYVLERVGNEQKEISVRFLGLWVDEDLTFSDHIAKMRTKLSKGIFALSASRNNTPKRIRLNIYFSLFESYLRFAAVLYGSAPEALLNEIFLMQKKAVRLVSNAAFTAHTDNLFKELGILKLEDLITLERLLLVHRFRANKLPSAFQKSFLQDVDINNMSRREDRYSLQNPSIPGKKFCQLPLTLLARSWNSQPMVLRAEGEVSKFKSDFIKSTLASYNYECIDEKCYSCNSLRDEEKKEEKNLKVKIIMALFNVYSISDSHRSIMNIKNKL